MKLYKYTCIQYTVESKHDTLSVVVTNKLKKHLKHFLHFMQTKIDNLKEILYKNCKNIPTKSTNALNATIYKQLKSFMLVHTRTYVRLRSKVNTNI